MMKKARKVAANQSPSPPSYQLAADEGRERIKIRSLMRDYEDLVKETEATKKRLLVARKNKQNLLAQVKFLRGKYKNLIKNPPQSSLYQPNYESQQTGPSTQMPLQSRKILLPYGVQPRNPGVKIELARKGKGPRQRKSVVLAASPTFDLNQTAFNTPKQHQFQRTLPMFASQPSDFPLKEKNHRGKEIPNISASAVLDLNQVATLTAEEAEYRFAWEAPTWERPAKHHTMEADHSVADLKLAACRNMGKVTSRNGKRKISWQDQLALRV